MSVSYGFTIPAHLFPDVSDYCDNNMIPYQVDGDSLLFAKEVDIEFESGEDCTRVRAWVNRLIKLEAV
jgi:hypothetical protein